MAKRRPTTPSSAPTPSNVVPFQPRHALKAAAGTPQAASTPTTKRSFAAEINALREQWAAWQRERKGLDSDPAA